MDQADDDLLANTNPNFAFPQENTLAAGMSLQDMYESLKQYKRETSDEWLNLEREIKRSYQTKKQMDHIELLQARKRQPSSGKISDNLQHNDNNYNWLWCGHLMDI